MKKIPDEELMKQFVRTLKEAPFDELVSRYIGKGIETASAMLNSRTDAEDAVQETFLRIIRSRETYNPSRPFAPWFFTILKNICWDIHAADKKEREKKLREQNAISEDTGLSPDKGDEILEVLSDPEKRILSMKIVHGLSIHEIARILNCSYDAAKKRCQRAMAKLRAKINHEDTKAQRKIGLSKQPKARTYND